MVTGRLSKVRPRFIGVFQRDDYFCRFWASYIIGATEVVSRAVDRFLPSFGRDQFRCRLRNTSYYPSYSRKYLRNFTEFIEVARATCLKSRRTVHSLFPNWGLTRRGSHCQHSILLNRVRRARSHSSGAASSKTLVTHPTKISVGTDG